MMSTLYALSRQIKAQKAKAKEKKKVKAETEKDHVYFPINDFESEAWPCDTIEEIEAVEEEMRSQGINRLEVYRGEGYAEIKIDLVITV